MFRMLDNIWGLWNNHKDKIDWNMQIVLLAYAIIVGSIVAVTISIIKWLS